MHDLYLEQLANLISIHQQVAGFNPALHARYPVAIVEGDEFLIYDSAADQSRYQFVKTSPVPMPVPKGVRAAFQLEDYGGRIACVVTPEVFDTREGYVTILHEFVHCYQYETCEQELKQQLDVAILAQDEGDVMWEIQYPFPYLAEAFTRGYQRFTAAVSRGDQLDIRQARAELHAYLGVHDFEYMVWQEWKEGFARWVENRVQEILGLCINTGGLALPFSRVAFYAGGAAFIDFLALTDPGLVDDLPRLFLYLNTPNQQN